MISFGQRNAPEVPPYESPAARKHNCGILDSGARLCWGRSFSSFERCWHVAGRVREQEAASTIGTLLDRINMLDQGEGPEPTRAQGKQALQAIAEKGLDAGWRSRMDALVKTIRSIPDDEEEAHAHEEFEQRGHQLHTAQ